jgi:hypothetical protein
MNFSCVWPTGLIKPCWSAPFLCFGVKPRHEAVKALQGLAREVYVVGDHSNPRNMMAAIHDAFTVAAEM